MSETLESLLSNEDAAIPSPRPSAFFGKSSLNPVDLDPSLILAAERGFVIAPALTHSRFASARSYVCAPMDGIDSIAQASARYPRCNWTLHVGASGLVVLEVDTHIGYEPLAILCRRSFGRWTQTLQFRDETSRFFLFRSIGSRVRFLGQRFRGLKVHTGNTFVFIPPSWFVSGLLHWVNQAPILDVPDWLTEWTVHIRRA
jgi:hypothetical protein